MQPGFEVGNGNRSPAAGIFQQNNAFAEVQSHIAVDSINGYALRVYGQISLFGQENQGVTRLRILRQRDLVVLKIVDGCNPYIVATDLQDVVGDSIPCASHITAIQMNLQGFAGKTFTQQNRVSGRIPVSDDFTPEYF